MSKAISPLSAGTTTSLPVLAIGLVPDRLRTACLRIRQYSTVAVVGVPDPDRTEIVAAYVVLQGGFVPGDELTRELQQHVRSRLSAHEYPRKVRYIDALPLTTTGKIIRRMLRALQD